MRFARLSTFAASCIAVVRAASATCPTTLTPSYPAPSVAQGYQARLVATGLTEPRGILFDNNGHLLVVQQGKGIASLDFTDDGGSCINLAGSHDVILDSTLNHGIELSADGGTLYASSAEALYEWSYDPSASRNTSGPRTLVENMTTDDHTTRTLLLSQKADGLMLINRGSTSNLDLMAADITTGHSQIKAFNVSNATTPYDFNTDGLLIGWGIRNHVGIAEEPITGGIFGVENSVDQMRREGEDIHQNNPGEELNFFGYLNGTYYAGQGQNYGYPYCYAAWDLDSIPENAGLQVGDQFAINSAANDSMCASDAISPRLTFQAHMAPLDILFNKNGTAAWIAFHGSWNRATPIGYKLSVVEFANGSPVAPSNSTTAAIDVMANQDNSRCPRSCFRPVGLAWDSRGTLYMSSDSSGEIWAITRVDGNPIDSATPTSSGGPSGTYGGDGAPAATTSQSSAARRAWTPSLDVLSVGLAALSFLL